MTRPGIEPRSSRRLANTLPTRPMSRFNCVIIVFKMEENVIKIIIIKRTCKIVVSAVPVHHRIKLKESEKKDKYLDLSWELKNYGT